MSRGSLRRAFAASLSLHLLLFLGARVAVRASPVSLSQSPLSIELVGSPIGIAEVAEPSPPETSTEIVASATEPEPASPPPPAPKRVVAKPPPPAPKRVVAKSPPSHLDGVRLATAADVRQRRVRDAKTDRVTPEVSAPRPRPSRLAARAPVRNPPAPSTRGDVQVVRTAFGPAWARTTEARPSVGHFRPDTPGYAGRIFGQVSVAAKSFDSSVYGRLHLFAKDDSLRGGSEESLFGFSFRHERFGGAVREIQVGRVQTHGAYLMVTDLFDDGRISSMSHSVLLAFPRDPPGGGHLYDVREEGGGAFRLRGPVGSSLLFDGRTGALRQAQGFVIGHPGARGSPASVSFRGLHVRIHSTGGNPFLRGRAASIVDARGARCSVSTSDLFAYPAGRSESDMFRYESDEAFFSFVASHCPRLELPRPSTVRIATSADAAPESERKGTGAGGLFGSLFGRSR